MWTEIMGKKAWKKDHYQKNQKLINWNNCKYVTKIHRTFNYGKVIFAADATVYLRGLFMKAGEIFFLFFL